MEVTLNLKSIKPRIETANHALDKGGETYFEFEIH